MGKALLYLWEAYNHLLLRTLHRTLHEVSATLPRYITTATAKRRPPLASNNTIIIITIIITIIIIIIIIIIITHAAVPYVPREATSERSQTEKGEVAHNAGSICSPSDSRLRSAEPHPGS